METLLSIIEICATIAFAISGIITARRRSFDLIGVYTVAFVTTFGGGTVRDILLDRRPFYWVQQPIYPMLMLGLAIGSFFVAKADWVALTEKAIMIPDAFGLGLFTAVGVAYGLEASMPAFIAALMGVITASVGGMLRDILCNEIPLVFQRSTQLYVTCAFVGACGYLLCTYLNFDALAVLVCTGITAAMRLGAVRYDWTLPI
ncbi:trimeric intracellular cation channel family protein [Herpetosiphon llansteffanensis]|uniref:trimeric intracellular cation channel family protein n=1 Tax=Herpetosiphon llansteffanensis TaxID=2094568 RepID=UPI000D7B99A8|nr:trimeric intracellular cation channel family protein [Herpetosiphon llansteffanensis]